MRGLLALLSFYWPQCRSFISDDDGARWTTYCYRDRWHFGKHTSYNGRLRWR